MKFLLLFWGIFVFSSCSHHKSVPKNNLPFSSKLQLSQLVGKYQNNSDAPEKEFPVTLSNILFPNSKFSQFVDYIEVKKISEKTLKVLAVSKDQVLESREFKLEKDFTIKDGRVMLKKESELSLLYPAGNPVLGYGQSRKSIGIDIAGNGKLQTNTFGLGTAFVVIPFAISTQSEVRFNRISP